MRAAVLLIKAAAAWRAEHSSLPSTSKERRDFKESIGNMKRMAGEVPVEVRVGASSRCDEDP